MERVPLGIYSQIIFSIGRYRLLRFKVRFSFRGVVAIREDSARQQWQQCKFTYKLLPLLFCVIVADNQALAIKQKKLLRRQTPRNAVSVERFWAPFFEKVRKESFCTPCFFQKAGKRAPFFEKVQRKCGCEGAKIEFLHALLFEKSGQIKMFWCLLFAEKVWRGST